MLAKRFCSQRVCLPHLSLHLTHILLPPLLPAILPLILILILSLHTRLSLSDASHAAAVLEALHGRDDERGHEARPQEPEEGR